MKKKKKDTQCRTSYDHSMKLRENVPVMSPGRTPAPEYKYWTSERTKMQIKSKDLFHLAFVEPDVRSYDQMKAYFILQPQAFSSNSDGEVVSNDVRTSTLATLNGYPLSNEALDSRAVFSLDTNCNLAWKVAEDNPTKPGKKHLVTKKKPAMRFVLNEPGHYIGGKRKVLASTDASDKTVVWKDIDHFDEAEHKYGCGSTHTTMLNTKSGSGGSEAVFAMRYSRDAKARTCTQCPDLAFDQVFNILDMRYKRSPAVITNKKSKVKTPNNKAVGPTWPVWGYTDGLQYMDTTDMRADMLFEGHNTPYLVAIPVRADLLQRGGYQPPNLECTEASKCAMPTIGKEVQDVDPKFFDPSLNRILEEFTSHNRILKSNHQTHALQPVVQNAEEEMDASTQIEM